MSATPATKRDNLIRKMCYDWIKQYETERFEKFKLIARIEIPPMTGRGPSRKGREHGQR